MSRSRKAILVVEDGTEYTEALRRLGGERPDVEIEFLRAADAFEARRLFSEHTIDGVLLDVVFDRTPAEKLAGDLEPLIARFAGDRRRAERYLAANQGFYLLDALSSLLPPGLRVILAYDFSDEPERLAALRERLPSLFGLPDGTPISEVLDDLLR